MKKNVMMRLASFLLVAVLISTTAISGTYAKYVTAAESIDQARVAKWGVEITANGSTFANVYATDDTTVATIANSVYNASEDNASEDLVAPGTKGNMVMMTISGKPEVAVSVTYEANFSVGNWVVDGTFYCPLVITVGEKKFDGKTYTDAETFETAVKKAIEEYSKKYGHNFDLTKAKAPTVSWEWPFSTGVNNDEKDTKLGNQAADGNPGKVTLSINTIVTQID